MLLMSWDSGLWGFVSAENGSETMRLVVKHCYGVCKVRLYTPIGRVIVVFRLMLSDFRLWQHSTTLPLENSNRLRW